VTLDALDKAIISALAEDGRQSQVDLAERVPLSPTAIARRIRTLEDDGVIEGYHAKISRRALGLEMMIVVQISLRSQSQDVLDAFEKAVAAAPSVVACHLMSGEEDYMLTVLARDLNDFERIHRAELSRLPGVARLRSSFVLREISSRAIPASSLSRKTKST
jgi:Lrp/AsnC family transcriptional regulator, leucine-responsive regulatory protein